MLPIPDKGLDLPTLEPVLTLSFFCFPRPCSLSQRERQADHQPRVGVWTQEGVPLRIRAGCAISVLQLQEPLVPQVDLVRAMVQYIPAVLGILLGWSKRGCAMQLSVQSCFAAGKKAYAEVLDFSSVNCVGS